MKSKLFKSLDAPLYVTIAIILVSVIERTNFIFNSPTIYIICILAAWLIRYGILSLETTKSKKR